MVNRAAGVVLAVVFLIKRFEKVIYRNN
ncbi:uncharacterized protein FTOL_10159 [Fusarium torulosum]|uniref:Uncharacterized protein n=1 Tax=Fusarium torulosum TaxID=33205 RepID=A0AAE8MGE5_9HYPO|nr:uncharacterized protein FTOL_10159 [Fusarium torulosum]